MYVVTSNTDVFKADALDPNKGNDDATLRKFNAHTFNVLLS
jgi:hypothetical protein